MFIGLGIGIPAVDRNDVALPATNIIDTDFGAAFPQMYPQVLSSISVSGATFSHQPTAQYVSGAPATVETTEGGIQATKISSFPTLNINLAATAQLQAGATYEVTMDFPIGFPDTNPAFEFIVDGRYALGKDLGGRFYTEGGEETVDRTGQPIVRRVIKSVQVAQTETDLDLWLRTRVFTAIGGGSGGNPTVSNVVVRKTAEPLPRNHYIRQFETSSDGIRDTQQNVTLPAGIEVGNHLVVLLRFGAGRTITAAPINWTLVARSADDICHVYEKTADGSEGGKTITWTTNSAINCASLIVENTGPLQTVNVVFSNAVNGDYVDLPSLDLGSAGPAGFVAFSSTSRTTPVTVYGSVGFSGNITWFSGQDGSTNGNDVKMLAGWKEDTAQTVAPSRHTWSGALYSPCAGTMAFR